MVWLPVGMVASPFSLSVKAVLLKLPATLRIRSKRKTTSHLFRVWYWPQAKVRWGKDPRASAQPRGAKTAGTSPRTPQPPFSPLLPPRDTKPGPTHLGRGGPRARLHRPRAGFTCGAEPQGGPAFPSCHRRCRRAASRLCRAERRTPAAAAGAAGKGSRGAVGKLGAEGGGGAARPSGRSLDFAGLCL